MKFLKINLLLVFIDIQCTSISYLFSSILQEHYRKPEKKIQKMKEIYFTYITYWINFFKGKPKHIALKQNLITTLLQT